MKDGFTNIAKGDLAIFGEFYVPDNAEDLFESAQYVGRGRYGIVLGLTRSRHVRGSGSECSLAIKKFNNPFKNAKRAQRCYRELQLLIELRHPNIVNMRGAYTTDESIETLDNIYLVTDYCGIDLNRMLEKETEKRHVLDLKTIKRMISELLRAVKYLTSAGVIHRDIKPDNIAVDENCKLTLVDFGFARVIDEDKQMTRDPGSSLYRAIETISFGGPEKMVYSEKVDIWAIGALLCEMIIGAPVFEHRHPLIRAVELCGPIPDNVLAKIDDKESQRFLQSRSMKAERVDFVDHLMKTGRPWLREEIEKSGEQLRNFIDRSLDFDQDKRMTVEEALSHPFLSSVRDISREHLASHKLTDVSEKSVDEWKELIWNLIQTSPIGI